MSRILQRNAGYAPRWKDDKYRTASHRELRRRGIYVPYQTDEAVQAFAHDDNRSYSSAVVELIEEGLRSRGLREAS